MADVDFASQLLSHAGERVKARLQSSLDSDTKQRDAQAQGLHDIVFSTSPDVTQADREAAQAELTKLYGHSKGAKEMFGKVGEFIQRIVPILKPPPKPGQQAQGGGAPAAGTPAAAPTASATPATPTTPASMAASILPPPPQSTAAAAPTQSQTLAPPPITSITAGIAQRMHARTIADADLTAQRQIKVKNEEEAAIAAAQANVAQIRADATTEAATTRANAQVKAAEERAKRVTETAVTNARKAGLIAKVDAETGAMTFEPVPEDQLTPQERATRAKTIAQGNQAQAAADRPAATTAASLALEAAKGDKIAERAMKILKPGDSTSLTPEAIGMLGQMFAMTGVLPSMGMGGKADRELVFNEAAHQIDGVTDLASQQAAYKANQSALTKQVTAQAAINSFEATAKENLERALGTAQKIVDSGSPLLNQPLRMIDEKLLGSTELAAFRTARQVALNEVAKITSNPNLTGVVSDSARKEVEALVSDDATLKQIYSAADILVKDMDSRKKNTDATVEALKEQIRLLGKPKSILPPPPKPSASTTPATPVTPPAKDVATSVSYGGKTYNFPNKAAADSFKKEMGIK